MKIYTSWYDNYEGERGVQITNSIPEGATVYKKLPMLYPRWNSVVLWNSVKDLPVGTRERQVIWSVFCEEYRAIINKLGFKKISEQLDDGDVLLGWFKTNCHRQILTRYLKERGIEVEELESVSSTNRILYPGWSDSEAKHIDTLEFGVR